MAGGFAVWLHHAPPPLPPSSKPILEFSLGGLEGWNLALHGWEEGLGGRRQLYKNTVLGAST